MACVLQAASAEACGDATLWRMITKKRKGSLEACLMDGRGGVLQESLVLSGHRFVEPPWRLMEAHGGLHGVCICIQFTVPPMRMIIVVCRPKM